MMSTLPFSLIQTNLHWENKSKNIQMLTEKLNALTACGHIIVLPEMFTTGFSMQASLLAESMNGETIQWLQNTAKEKKSIITGSIIIEEENNHAISYYNRLIWMQPDGKLGYYDKRHLFSMADEDKHYMQGEKRILFSVGGWKILPLICYDLRFPVWSRQQPSEKGKPEYDVLLYIANWPEKRIYAWRSLLVARAIENQCYVVAVNRVGADGNNIPHNGNSMVIDPMGEVIFESMDEEIIKTITLSRSHLEQCRQKFPFLKDGDDYQLVKD
jgi:omega-amidase